MVYDRCSTSKWSHPPKLCTAPSFNCITTTSHFHQQQNNKFHLIRTLHRCNCLHQDNQTDEVLLGSLWNISIRSSSFAKQHTYTFWSWHSWVCFNPVSFVLSIRLAFSIFTFLTILTTGCERGHILSPRNDTSVVTISHLFTTSLQRTFFSGMTVVHLWAVSSFNNYQSKSLSSKRLPERSNAKAPVGTLLLQQSHRLRIQHSTARNRAVISLVDIPIAQQSLLHSTIEGKSDSSTWSRLTRRK